MGHQCHSINRILHQSQLDFWAGLSSQRSLVDSEKVEKYLEIGSLVTSLFRSLIKFINIKHEEQLKITRVVNYSSLLVSCN